MLEAKIIDRGRGPEIAGTRITVYDVLDYHKSEWHRDMIADTRSSVRKRSKSRSVISRNIGMR